MATLQMTPADLGELEMLLKTYGRTYGTTPGGSSLLAEVSMRYREQYRLVYGAECPDGSSNMRNAGRKPVYTEEKRARIWTMYWKEGKTIREIAAAESCSLSYVHKSIHGPNPVR